MANYAVFTRAAVALRGVTLLIDDSSPAAALRSFRLSALQNATAVQRMEILVFDSVNIAPMAENMENEML